MVSGMKSRINILLLVALLSSAAVQAQNDKAAGYLRRLADRMESMKSYSVSFTASADDGVSISGRYEVDGSRYHIAMTGVEVYGNDELRHEIDVAHREIVVDAVDTVSRDLMKNPVRGFRFLGTDYNPQLRSEADGLAEIVLTRTAKSGDADNITVTLSTSEALPQKIRYDYDGESVAIVIESIAQGVWVPTFDAADYPDYEIIDFR